MSAEKLYKVTFESIGDLLDYRISSGKPWKSINETESYMIVRLDEEDKQVLKNNYNAVIAAEIES